MGMKFFCRLGLVCLLIGQLPVFSEVTLQFRYQPGGKYKITEISDLRRWVNDSYTGFTCRQIRGVLDVVSVAAGQQRIAGNFFVFAETKRNTRLIANQIDRIIPVAFSLGPDGSYLIPETAGYPASRNFPVFPGQPLTPGDSWQAYGTRVVEPFNDGIFTRVKFYCEYTYKGIDTYKGVPAHLITAQYAVRYKAGADPAGDPRIKEIRYGGHLVTIYFGINTGKPLFIRDNIIENLGGEVYILNDNSTITIKGFTQTWFDDITALDKDHLITEINKELDPEQTGQIKVTDEDDGVRLSLPEIRFYPDSNKILTSETARLDAVFKILAGIPDRSFLVTGHTADTGNPEGEYKLSVERAKAIADYLIGKGLDPGRFLFEGKGAGEPVAPNDTEANMAKNRRVEITILED